MSSRDPFGELTPRRSLPPGLKQRFPDRVLVMTTSRCFSACPHCTRKFILGAAPVVDSPGRLAACVDYVKRHPKVRDVLLSGGGEDVEYIKEVYIPDEDSGLFHRLTAVIDQETGEVDVGVEQDGVPQGDFAPSVSIPDENGDYHKLVAVRDPDTGKIDIGVIH